MATSAANIAEMPVTRSVLALASENARSAASNSSAICVGVGVCAVTSAAMSSANKENSVFTLLSLPAECER
jgi:hypothetical protein